MSKSVLTRRFGIHAEVSVDDFIGYLLAECNDAELAQIIKQIDSCVADYDFTKGLAEHFNGELYNEDKERICDGRA